jgi:hypothetical protein
MRDENIITTSTETWAFVSIEHADGFIQVWKVDEPAAVTAAIKRVAGAPDREMMGPPPITK